MAVLVGVLRGFKSIRAIWRRFSAGGCWNLACYDIGDQAIYNRLEQEGWKPLAQLFERISLLLAEFLQPALQAYHQRHAILAPFATEVIALDEMFLDQVSRRLPILRHFKKGDAQLLLGKLVALFDVRLGASACHRLYCDSQRERSGGGSRLVVAINETRGPRGSRTWATSALSGLMS